MGTKLRINIDKTKKTNRNTIERYSYSCSPWWKEVGDRSWTVPKMQVKNGVR